MKRLVAAVALAAGVVIASGAQATNSFRPVAGEVVGTFLGLHCLAFKVDGDDKIYGFSRTSLGPPVSDIPAGIPINEDAVGEIDSAFNNHTMITFLAVENVPGVPVVVPYCSAVPVSVQQIQGIRKGSFRE